LSILVLDEGSKSHEVKVVRHKHDSVALVSRINPIPQLSGEKLEPSFTGMLITRHKWYLS